MTCNLLPLLRCTAGCDAPLEICEGRWVDSEMMEGTLRCRACGRTHEVREGIARMLPEDLTPSRNHSNDDAAHQKRSEMQARDSQVEEYDRMWHLNLFGLVEIPAMLLNLSLSPAHTLLEAGSGTGRMTPEFAARCAHLVSIDFSWESLRACRRKLARVGVRNVDLILADLCNLPLRAEAFDRVVSGQVLEHIPTRDARESAVSELARVLKAGGNLVLSAYQYSLLMRLFGQKEGTHEGGIYFFRFTRNELRDLLARHLRVEGITGALVYHYIARCRKEGVRCQVSGCSKGGVGAET